MALVCPPKEDSVRRREVLCKLKNVVDKLTADEGPVPFYMCPPPPPCCRPCCCCCPCPPCSPVEEAPKEVFCKPPEVMVCYRVKKSAKAADKDTKTKGKKDNDSKVKQSKSRELRGGILYVGCDCEKRNGLQDDCQRSECHGSPACLTKPKPTCGPSEFSNGKHLGKKCTKGGASGGGGANAGDGGNQGGGDDAMGEYECFPAVLDTNHSCPCTS